MSALQPAISVLPMPAGRRFRIATTTSLGFHTVVVLLIGLFAARGSVRPEVLIPIELTVAEPAQATLALGGGGRPEAPVRTTAAPTIVERPTKSEPSSAGGTARRAPAPPRILTSNRGSEPAGPVGRGREAAGPGGKVEEPGGPTYGASAVGGALPIYPKHALDQNLEGRVTLVVSVGPDGKVEAVTVESSSGEALLDEAAVRAVKEGWAFQAGMANGKPAPGKVRVTFEFSGASVKRG